MDDHEYRLPECARDWGAPESYVVRLQDRMASADIDHQIAVVSGAAAWGSAQEDALRSVVAAGDYVALRRWAEDYHLWEHCYHCVDPYDTEAIESADADARALRSAMRRLADLVEFEVNQRTT